MSASSKPPALPRDDLAWQLLQEISEAVLLVDQATLAVLEASLSAEILTGWPRAQLVGQPLSQVMVANGDQTLDEWLSTPPATPEPSAALPFTCRTRERGDLDVSLSVRKFQYEQRDAALVTIREKSGESDLTTALAHSEERFHQLFEESPLALMEMDWSDIHKALEQLQNSDIDDLAGWLEENPDEIARLSKLSRITAVNRRTLEMFQASGADEFMGSFGNLLRHDSLLTFRDHLLFRLKGGRTFNRENIAYTMTGDRLYIHVSATAPSLDDAWNPVYASISDITDRRHAQLLRDGQRRVLEMLASGQPVDILLRTLAVELEEQSPYLRAAVYRTANGGQVLQMMSSAGTAQEVVTLTDGVGIHEVFENPVAPTEVRFAASSQKHSSQKPELSHQRVIELLTRTIGICGYESGLLRPMLDSSGQTLGMLAVFRCESPVLTSHEEDVVSSFTDLAALVLEHDQRRQALTVRTEELQSVFQTYPDALLRIASDGTILEHYSGTRLNEILHLSEVPSEQLLWQLLPQNALTPVRAAIESVGAGSRQETVEFTVNDETDRRNYEARFLPLPTSDEQIAVLRDVTPLKKAEQALEYASERFRYLFDSSPDAIFVESPEGVVLNANQAACTLHRLSRDELIGMDVLSLIPAEDRDTASVRSEAMLSGTISEFESRSLRSDGQVVPVGVRISTITYDGNPAVLLHVRDITQQKNEEERQREHDRHIAHVSRLTMMGQLVAGIAHEIRQPLWSLTNFADVCSEALNRPDYEERLPQIRNVVDRLVTEARRVTAITTRMFSFARKGKPERETCNLGDIIDDAIQLTAGRARSSRISTTLDLDKELPAILCDRVLIEQTVVNLLNNAYTALASHPSNVREVSIEAGCTFESPEFVSISILDNGPGLPDGVAPEQLFEGFFTTGQSGLGIGLALSRSFVEDHGGEIRAEERPAGGMQFTFTLRVDGGSPANAD